MSYILGGCLLCDQVVVGFLYINCFFCFFRFFGVRLLLFLRGHSVFPSPPQRPMTSDFEGFSIPDFINYILFPILILQKEPVFPFLMLSAKQGNYWYHFNNVFGMTRSLTGDWTRGPPALEASTLPLGFQRGGI